jgi:uncharacterized protein (UPF0335 family)
LQLIPKEHLIAPGVCVVCEHTPVDGQQIVDTLRTLQAGVVFTLNGRKYLCESCIVAAGNIIGLVSDKQAKDAVEKATRFEAELNAVKDHIKDVVKHLDTGHVAEVARAAAPVVEKAVTRKAKPKTAALPEGPKTEPVASPNEPAPDVPGA